VSDADGVHLGQDDMEVDDARKILGKDKIIGISAGNEVELDYALNQDVNYIAPGPVFGTTTKTDAGKPIGIDFVKLVQSKTEKPVIPIGGINAENISQLKDIGISCFAVISSILKYDNLENATKKLY
jgi:thiamine-phosphate pyrophosphorylase